MNNSSILLGFRKSSCKFRFCLLKTTCQLIESLLISPCRVALQQAMQTIGDAGLGLKLVPPSSSVCPFHLVCPRWCCMHIDLDMLAMGLECRWPGSLSHNS